MNFVGHIRVAANHGLRLADGAGPALSWPGGESSKQAVLIGAALPDVAAMGRFRLVGEPSDPGVRAGVALHHRTDDLFHSHRWFRTHSQSVTAALTELGLARGAARACGHVGVELLLDGFLLETDRDLRPKTERAMAAVTEPALGLTALVDPERRQDWSQHLERTAGWPVPADYRDSAAVAERLRRILARRPRLSFDRDQTTRVAESLAGHQADIERGADELIADLARLLEETERA